MPARRSLRLWPGITIALLCSGLACAASVKELHNQTDSVSAPGAAGDVSTTSAADPLRQPAAPGLTFQLDGDSWGCFRDSVTEKLYFHNHGKSVSQWSDPRVAALERQHKKQLTPKDKRLRLSIAVVLLASILIAMSGRIIYLQKYFPELLWPTKERKNRKKYRNKETMPTQRFKVSQDGKGGRSANS